MSRREEAEEAVVREFSVLQERHDYSAPLVRREAWFTRVDFVKGDIGIEVELDWRDLSVNVLAVRLHNGQLPRGYYVEEGRPCRKHIVSVARERKWPNAPPAPRRARGHHGSGPKELVQAARGTRDLILGWLDRLEGEWLEIWRKV